MLVKDHYPLGKKIITDTSNRFSHEHPKKLMVFMGDQNK